MKVYIRQEECICCENCVSTCPEVFLVVHGKSSTIVEKYRGKNDSEGEIEEDLKNCVESAADSCPVEIISIE